MNKYLLTAMAVMGAASAQAIVFPTGAHAAYNFIPFGAAAASGIPTMHQVFASNLFSAQTGGQAALISSIGFAPGVSGSISLGQITINLGYTNAIPGVLSGAGGLVTPTEGGGGNNVGAMTNFYSNANTQFTVTTVSTSNFGEVVFTGTPFVYDPNNGNLLVEIVAPSLTNTTFTVSRTAGGPESSRAYAGTRFANGESPTTATRMDFTFTTVPEPGTFIAIGAGLALLALRKRRS